MALLRVKMRWSGINGGNGYSVFHFEDFGSGPDGWDPGPTDAANVVAKVDTFAQGILGVLPAGVTLQVLGDVDEITETTGALVDLHSVTAPAARTPSHSAGPYSAPTGAVISWRTGVVHRGRRIRGRTFLVPCIGAAFENNGTLTSTAINTITTAANALMTNGAATGDLAVYARPSAPGATDGMAGIVSGFSVPDMGAVLRSRR
jgi:hypothetical protein